MISYYLNDLDSNSEYVISLNSEEKKSILNFMEEMKNKFAHMDSEIKKRVFDEKDPKKILQFVVSYANMYMQLDSNEKRRNFDNEITKTFVFFCALFAVSYEMTTGIHPLSVVINKYDNYFSCSISSHCTFVDN